MRVLAGLEKMPRFGFTLLYCFSAKDCLGKRPNAVIKDINSGRDRANYQRSIKIS